MGIDFNKLKTDIVSAGKEVGDKVSEASNVAKLKLDIHTKEDFVEKQFAALGRAYYEAHKDDDVPEKDFFASYVSAVQCKAAEGQFILLELWSVIVGLGKLFQIFHYLIFCQTSVK